MIAEIKKLVLEHFHKVLSLIVVEEKILEFMPVEEQMEKQFSTEIL